MVSIIWSAVTVALIIAAVKRDENGRAFVPWSFPALGVVLTATSFFWSEVEFSWLVWLLLGAAIVVVVARFGIAMVAVVASALLVFGPVAASALTSDSAASTAPSSPTAASPEESNADSSDDGCSTWATKSADYGNTRWFANGITKIKQAKTDKEARRAANVWTDRVKQDPLLLASAAQSVLGKEVDKANLSMNGCATDAAVEVATEIEAEFAQADISVVSAAPAGAVTSGVNGSGQMVAFPVTGNDQALKIMLSSGKTIYVESDCGNVVTDRPVYPPKDNPPPPDDNPPPPDDNPPPCEEDCGPPPCEVDCEPVDECPPGQVGTPPNCEEPPCEVDCEPVDECPPGTTGTPPDCLEIKDPVDDPTPPDGVDPLPQGDPVENTPPPLPENPIDTDEEPGDSVPDVPAPDSDPVEPPADDGPPPPPVTDEDNTPSEEDPGTEIPDPDAGLLFPLFPLLVGAARLRRR